VIPVEDEEKNNKELTEEPIRLGRRLADVNDGVKTGEFNGALTDTNGKGLPRVFDAIPDFVAVIDTRYEIVKANKALADILGVAREDLIGKKCYEVVHGTDAPPEFCRQAECLDSKVVATTEFFDDKLGGHFEVTTSPVFNENDEAVGSLHIIRDINERKRVEDALRKGEEWYRNLFEHANDAIIVRDLRGRTAAANGRAGELFGYPVEDLQQRRVAEFLTVGDDVYGKVFSGEGVITETTGVRNDGHVFPVEVSVRSTYWGDEVMVLMFVRDLTERKRAEETLRQSEERFRELAETLPETVFETDIDGKLTFVNRKAFDIFGYSKEDLNVGINIFDLFPPEELERARENFAKHLGGEEVGSSEYKVTKRNGSPFQVAIHAVPIVRNGNVEGIRGIVVDITEQKRIEEELAKAAKLESIGVLAGGIAHDFNNLLAVILGNVTYVKSNVPAIERERAVEALSAAERATLRARDLTEQLLTFSAGGAPVKETINIKRVVEESAAFSARGTNVRCISGAGDDLWPVDADESQIGQVINNLVINAVQAMPEGGEVRVRCDNYVAGSDKSPDMPALEEGKYVRISVADTGVGIPQEYVQKVFDPFFTTKYKGSGLGLSTSYSIVKNHGGVITVESEIGVGTTFNVYLPASDKPIKESEVGPDEVIPGEGRVLVMDDEASIRELVSEVLVRSGYEVDVAGDGAEAVELYKTAASSDEPYDAVILDLTVPGGSGGVEAIQELLVEDPGVKAIVSSGYSTDPVLANYDLYGFRGFIKKPFRIADLTKVLRDVIAGD
jgi:PAS domain S-box-containing protein